MTIEEAIKAWRNFSKKEYVALEMAIKVLKQQLCNDAISRQEVLDGEIKMTKEEKAIIYFKDMRNRLCEDYLNICPKYSIAYKTKLAEKDFYDIAIQALQKGVSQNEQKLPNM